MTKYIMNANEITILLVKLLLLHKTLKTAVIIMGLNISISLNNFATLSLQRFEIKYTLNAADATLLITKDSTSM